MRDKIIAVRLDDVTLEELDWLATTSGNISRSRCVRLLILFASQRFGAPSARFDFAVFCDCLLKTPVA